MILDCCILYFEDWFFKERNVIESQLMGEEIQEYEYIQKNCILDMVLCTPEKFPMKNFF